MKNYVGIVLQRLRYSSNCNFLISNPEAVSSPSFLKIADFQMWLDRPGVDILSTTEIDKG